MGEMNKLQLDILGVANTWWPCAGTCNTEDGIFFYSENEDLRDIKGIGNVITKVKMRGRIHPVIR